MPRSIARPTKSTPRKSPTGTRSRRPSSRRKPRSPTAPRRPTSTSSSSGSTTTPRTPRSRTSWSARRASPRRTASTSTPKRARACCRRRRLSSRRGAAVAGGTKESTSLCSFFPSIESGGSTTRRHPADVPYRTYLPVFRDDDVTLPKTTNLLGFVFFYARLCCDLCFSPRPTLEEAPRRSARRHTHSSGVLRSLFGTRNGWRVSSPHLRTAWGVDLRLLRHRAPIVLSCDRDPPFPRHGPAE
mmetsp:Transcript_26346/g.105457  ORF Transcript_26346/g.105457 Transcript_26346/m.105457 type:complete len:243 (+) Transcript_26346:374-1102(+)